ncbi:MAG: aldose 1-epimerase [Victivallales bacterium]|nr:aldose 1-epimerase [Victivallales bacterium]
MIEPRLKCTAMEQLHAHHLNNHVIISLRLSILTVLLFLGGALSTMALAADVIQITPDKLTLGARASLDETVRMGDRPSVKLVCTDAKQVAKAEMELPLDEETEFYELSFYVKAEGIVSDNSPLHGADVWLKPAKGGALRFSSRGTYKSDTGTFDWKKASYKVHTKRYLKEKPATIILRLTYATGTVWFDQVKLTPFNKNLESAAEKEGFSFGIFPMCFQKPGEAYEIAENLPAQWTLKCFQRPKNPSGKQLTLTLNLPDYLELVGVGGLISQTLGNYFPLQQIVVDQSHPGYRKYTIPFDSLLSGLIKSNWRRNCIMIRAKPGSAGKRDSCHWQVDIDGTIVSKGDEPIAVVPPVKMEAPPCRRFLVGVFAPASRFSAFQGSSEEQDMSAFWHSLTQKEPLLFGAVSHGDVPGYHRILYFGGMQMEGWVPLPEYQEFKKSMPPSTGRAAVSSWYPLEDPKGTFEAYLKALFPLLRERYPNARDIFLNVEPYVEQGYDQEGRERFARVQKLDIIPTEEECKGPLRTQWEQYMLEVHRQLIAKLANRIHQEGYRLLLCTNKIDSRFGPGTWTAGVDAMDADKYADENLIMGYAIGTKFFDDVTLNRRHQKKPIFPGQDPAEELKAWFDTYTPKGVRQNVVAAAALGCIGIWYYPTDILSASYLRAIAEGYGLVSKYEEYYMEGSRCDDELKIIAKNSASRTVTGDDGKPVTIYYPDFSGKLRFTVHEWKGRRLLTLFNYTNERLLLEASEKSGHSFLFAVDPMDVAQIITSEPPEHASLAAEIAAAERKFGSPILKESRQGDALIQWGAGQDGEPVIRLVKGTLSADLDVFNSLEIRGLKKDGVELLRNGFIGRVAFHIPKQEPVRGEVVELGITDGKPDVKIAYQVPRFADEDTAVNPLEKLEITRIYRLTGNALEVETSFRNPTDKLMPFPVRLLSQPMPGSRFGATRRELSTGSLTVGDEPDSVYLVEGAQSTFLPTIRNGVWKPAPLVVSAQDGALREAVTIEPGEGYSGFYSWLGTRGGFMRTVELLLPESPLAPGETRTFHYQAISN